MGDENEQDIEMLSYYDREKTAQNMCARALQPEAL